MSSLAAATRWLDATEQAALVRSGQVRPSELLEAAVERIELLDPALNAVVMRWFDRAADAVAAGLPAGPLRGVPFLLKDLAAPLAGAPMASGNRRLKEAALPAAADSTLVARFRSAGLVIAGRTNTSEFGSLAGTEPRAWGPARNPWLPALSPGGSSGGSAAAVAAGIVPIAHGSDASGSIRIPASCCGLVGLKPSRGRISNGPDGDKILDAVGFCLSRTVRDSAAVLDAIRGPGVGDAAVAPAPARTYLAEVAPESSPRIGARTSGLRIGVLDAYPGGEPVDDECRRAVLRTADLLEDLGHHVEPDHPTALDRLDLLADTTPVQWSAMAVRIADLARTLGRGVTADDVEPVNWERAARGRRVSGVDYARALHTRMRLRRALRQWWADGADLLLTPTVGALPPPVGSMAGDDPAAGERSRGFVAFTKPFNISGQPAISLPTHRTPAGVPVGVQLVAGYGREDVLLRVAAELERVVRWVELRPPAV